MYCSVQERSAREERSARRVKDRIKEQDKAV